MIGALKPHPAMKDSGVEWLEQIPVHWELLRGKILFRCIDVRSTTGEEELLTVSSERGVVPRSSATVTMFKAESYVGYKLCWPSDLVINSLWAWARGLGVSQHHGIVSSAYGVYRLRDRYSQYSSYIDRLVRSNPFNFELRIRSKGIWTSRLQLTDEAFLDAPFPIPSVEDQTAIVRFLDYADRRIRLYIRAKQKLITLLEEQKQAIIHQAVTGQIDVRTGQPYLAYKPSGVEWLGDVPAHWETPRIKQCARTISKGTTPSTEGRETSEYGQVRFLKAENITSGEISDKPLLYIDEDTNNLLRRSQLQEGDVLFVIAGATLGKTALVREELLPANTNQAVAFIRPHKRLDSIYLAYWLQSPRVKELTWLNAVQSAQPNLSMTNLGNFLIPFSPFPEQAAIVSYLDKATAAVDIVIRRTRYQIDHLSEYRTRLIADVVTGKFDVREAAAALPETDPLAAEDDLDETFAAGDESEFDNEEELAEAAD